MRGSTQRHFYSTTLLAKGVSRVFHFGDDLDVGLD